MRLASLFCLVLISTTLSPWQEQAPDTIQPNSEDRYSVAVVSAALQFLKREGVGNSIEAKRYIWPLLPLGDRVSIAVLKIYSASELVQTENAEGYLTAVRNAFSSRSSVHGEADADPKVTQFLLQYLKEKEVSNPGIQKRIVYMEGCVKDFTCSSQGEFAFFHKP